MIEQQTIPINEQLADNTIIGIKTQLKIKNHIHVSVNNENYTETNPFRVLNEGDTLYFWEIPQDTNVAGALIPRPTMRLGLSALLQVGSMYVGRAVGGSLGVAAQIGTSITGLMAIHTLLPLPALDLEEVGHSISGVRNRARLGEVVPKIFGKIRTYPAYATNPWTEVQGDNQYLRLILAVGSGPLKLSDLKLGDEPITNFEDVEYEFLEGRPGDRFEDTVFANTVHQKDISENLLEDQWVYSETEENTDEIGVELLFPEGIQKVYPEDSIPIPIDFDVEYRQKGTTRWLKAFKIDNYKPDEQDIQEQTIWDSLDNIGQNLTDWRIFLEDVLNAGTEDDIAEPIREWLVNFTRNIENRIIELQENEELVAETTNEQNILDTIQNENKNIGDILVQFGITAIENVSNSVQEVINNLTEQIPVLNAFVELERDLQLGTIQDLGYYPLFSRFMLWRQGLLYATGGPEEITSGNVVDATIGSITFDTNATSEANSYYLYYVTVEDDQGNNRQTRRIRQYDSDNKIAYIETDWNVIPDNTWNYQIHDRAIWRVTGDTEVTTRRSLTFGVKQGQYEVRVRRITPDHTDNDDIRSESQWSLLRSIKREKPINLDIEHITHVALIGLRIKATEQVQGNLEQVNCIAHSYLYNYNDEKEELSQNPAWCFMNVLTGKDNARPIPLEKIDLNRIKQWAIDLDNEEFYSEDSISPSDPDKIGREFNLEIDRETNTHDVLNTICSAGRAKLDLRDGIYSILQDGPNKTPVSLFTPDNTWDFSWDRPFLEKLHGIRVSFLNEDQEYRRSDRTVYMDGFDEYPDDFSPSKELAENFEDLELTGQTDPIQIYKDGRLFLSKRIHRQEGFSFRTGLEGHYRKIGEVIEVISDEAPFGLGGGLIKEVTRNASNEITHIKLDQEIIPAEDPEENYIIIDKKKNDIDEILTKPIVNYTEKTNTFELVTPFVDDEIVNELLCGIGQSAQLLITEIRYRDEDNVSINAVMYNPFIYDSDTEPIPPFDPDVTIPDELNIPAPPKPILDSAESTLIWTSDRTKVNGLNISLQPLPENIRTPEKTITEYILLKSVTELLGEDIWDMSATEIQRSINQYLKDNAKKHIESGGSFRNYSIYPLSAGRNYEFSVRYQGIDGQKSLPLIFERSIQDIKPDEGFIPETEQNVIRYDKVITQESNVLIDGGQKITFGNIDEDEPEITLEYNPERQGLEVKDPSGEVIQFLGYYPHFTLQGGDTASPFVINRAAKGSEKNRIEVTTIQELQNIVDDTNNEWSNEDHYIIINDIDASDTINWNSGAGFDPGIFYGSIDGNGHEITDLYINDKYTNGGGIFKRISYKTINNMAYGGYVKNLILRNPYIKRANESGFIAGRIGIDNNDLAIAKPCTIENVQVINGDLYTSSDSGGLVGLIEGSTKIQNCDVDNISIDVDPDVQSFNNDQLGALIGRINNNYNTIIKIKNNKASGTIVNGEEYIGGLFGELHNAEVSYCLSNVNPSTASGSIVGFNGTNNTYTEVFWNSDISDSTDDSENETSINGISSKTTIELQELATFNNWDIARVSNHIDETWIFPDLDGEDYPYLAWTDYTFDPYSFEPSIDVEGDIKADGFILNDEKITSWGDITASSTSLSDLNDVSILDLQADQVISYDSVNSEWINKSIVAGSTGNIQFNDNGSFSANDYLFWDNTNNKLGIGTTTPRTQLEIFNRSSGIDDLPDGYNSRSVGLLIKSDPTQDNTRPGIVQYGLRTSNSGIAYNINTAYIGSAEDNIVKAATMGIYGTVGETFADHEVRYIYLGARSDTAYNSAVLKIDYDEKIGIGIPSSDRPLEKLEVYNGNIFINSGGKFIRQSDESSGDILNLYGYSDTHHIDLEYGVTHNTTYTFQVNGGDGTRDIAFHNSHLNQPYINMQEDTGYVGINETNPLAQLDVNGDIEVSGTLNGLDVSYLDGTVIHGSDNTTARPNTYNSINWIGSVQPDNWLSGDSWFDTSG